jgi:hypothetical protein
MGLSTDGYIVHSYSVFGAAMPKKPLPRFNPVDLKEMRGFWKTYRGNKDVEA